jgi:hypothetical protein
MRTSLSRSNLGLALLIVTMASGCAGFTKGQVRPEPLINPATNNNSQNESTEQAPAMVVYIDPKTGQIITPPPGALPGQGLQQEGVTRPLADLQQTLSPVPGGGVVIHLDERFMNPLTATIDAEGKLRIEHQSTIPSSDDKK